MRPAPPVADFPSATGGAFQPDAGRRKRVSKDSEDKDEFIEADNGELID